MRIAIYHENCARAGKPVGGGQYDRRVANTIREAVYDEDPDLRPGV